MKKFFFWVCVVIGVVITVITVTELVHPINNNVKVEIDKILTQLTILVLSIYGAARLYKKK